MTSHQSTESNWVPQHIDRSQLFDYAWLADPLRRPLQPQQHSFHDMFTSRIGGVPSWLTAEHIIGVSSSSSASQNDTAPAAATTTTMIAPPPPPSSSPSSPSSSSSSSSFSTIAEMRAVGAQCNPMCKYCGKRMMLVTQCYVPMGPLERVIYVFGCNSSSCSSKSDGFVAYRLQFKLPSSETQQGTVGDSNSVDAQIQQVLEQKTRTDNILRTHTSSAGDTDATHSVAVEGDLASSQNVEDDELEDLLKLRDMKLQSDQRQQQQQQQQQSGRLSKATKENKSKQKQLQSLADGDKYLPCFALETYEEPEFNPREYNIDDDDGENDEDGNDRNTAAIFAAGTSKSSSSSSSSNRKKVDMSHEYALLHRYMTENVVSASSNSDSGSDSTSTTTTTVAEELLGEGGEEGDEDGAITQMVNPAIAELIKDDAFINFQATLSNAPEQSIRWHFDGEPLWITEKPSTLPRRYVECMRQLEKQMEQLNPIDRDDFERKIVSKCVAECIPKCPRCGSARVFELQVMPTVVYQMKTWKYTNRKDDEGMDFGTVTVFTCSRQCMPPEDDPSCTFQYVQEHVHVQPPV